MRVSNETMVAAQLGELCNRAEAAGRRWRGDDVVGAANRRARRYAAFFKRLTGLHGQAIDDLLAKRFVAGAHSAATCAPLEK